MTSRRLSIVGTLTVGLALATALSAADVLADEPTRPTAPSVAMPAAPAQPTAAPVNVPSVAGETAAAPAASTAARVWWPPPKKSPHVPAAHSASAQVA